MPNSGENPRTITEEVAFRTGFAEGAKEALRWIPKFLDKGLPLIDAIRLLEAWTEKLERWAREVLDADGNGNSAPPRP